MKDSEIAPPSPSAEGVPKVMRLAQDAAIMRERLSDLVRRQPEPSLVPYQAGLRRAAQARP